MNINTEILGNIYFYLWILICTMQSMVTVWAYFKCFSTKIGNSVIASLIMLASLIIPVFPKVLLTENPIASALLLLFLPVICGCLITSGSRIMTLIFFVISFILDILVDFALMQLLYALPDGDISIHMRADEYTYIRVLFSILFLFLITPVKYYFAKLWNKKINKRNYDKSGWMFIVFPLAQALAIAAIILRQIYSEYFSTHTDVMHLVAFIIFAISDILFLGFISDIEKKNMLERELKAVESMQALEARHYENIEAKRYETAKIRHDIRNHIAAVNALIASGNISEAKEVISSLEESIEATREYEYCGISIINALLSEKHSYCKNNGIEFTADISADSPGIISGMHICSVFSNLIDNAIAENLKIGADSKRYISLKAFQKGGYFLIKAVNPVSDETDNHRLDPMKSRGCGLRILSDLADRYDGDFSAEISNGVCTAVISLKYAESPQ